MNLQWLNINFVVCILFAKIVRFTFLKYLFVGVVEFGVLRR